MLELKTYLLIEDQSSFFQVSAKGKISQCYNAKISEHAISHIVCLLLCKAEKWALVEQKPKVGIELVLSTPIESIL